MNNWQTEAQFQSKVIRFLKEQGAYVIKIWGGGKYTRAGVPDIIACVNGYFIAVELKTETGRVSKLQEFNLENIWRAGGASMVLRPAGFEDFKRFIEEVKCWPKPFDKCNSPIPASARINNARHNTNTATSTV